MDQVLTPDEWLQRLGEAIRDLRLAHNLAQVDLASQAGVSRTALRHLESGEGATLSTLIRIIRALGREDWLASLTAQPTINPLHMVRQAHKRQRASRSTGDRDGDPSTKG
jgi:transcriptional regulator with XRE-family HTH domain